MAFRDDYLKLELGKEEAVRLLAENDRLLKYYKIYDGEGQNWATKGTLDYEPTKKVTNNIKFLIKEVVRFMLSRAPEIAIITTTKDKSNEEKCAALEAFVRKTLQENGFAGKLTKAGRDQLIAGRVALKVTGQAGQPLKIAFRPALEVWAQYDIEDAERLNKLIYLYQTKEAEREQDQVFWVQKYEIEENAVYVSEKTVDGTGALLDERLNKVRLPIPYIPSYLIINDGLTGDVSGESEVKELTDLAASYNRITSDDQDALRFNMFPQSVFTDASQASLENIKVAPKAIIDLQSDSASGDLQAKAQVLESGFNYGERAENVLNRIDVDMRKMLGVPPKSLDEYKANGVSGKALKALYWSLITKCEEKWTEWDTALTWLVKCLYDLAVAYGLAKDFNGVQYSVKIEHLYPLTDDEEEERAQDLREVVQKTRSVKSYLEKWYPDMDSEAELQQIVKEQRMLEEQF